MFSWTCASLAAVAVTEMVTSAAATATAAVADQIEQLEFVCVVN